MCENYSDKNMTCAKVLKVFSDKTWDEFSWWCERHIITTLRCKDEDIPLILAAIVTKVNIVNLFCKLTELPVNKMTPTIEIKPQK